MPESKTGLKPGSIKKIEARLEGLEAGSLRYEVLDTCRRFKTSWIEFGQVLYGVFRDKSYRQWNYSDFEAYCKGELGIRQPTALKLVRSYAFLESDEPAQLKRAIGPLDEEGPGKKTPDLDAVNLLRLVRKNRRIPEEDYREIRKKVFEEARDPQDLRKEIRLLTESTREADPEEARSDRRQRFLRQLVRQIEQAKLEAMAAKLLPAKLIDELDELGQKIERELNRD